MRVLPIGDSGVLIGASGLQELGIPVRSVDEGLDTRTKGRADHARADRAQRAGHLPVDEAELASAVYRGLSVELCEQRAVHHHAPPAEGRVEHWYERRIG